MDRYFLHMEFPSKDKAYWEEETGGFDQEDESEFPGWVVWEIGEISSVHDCLQEAGESGKSFLAQWSGYDCNRVAIGHAGRWEDTDALDCSPVVKYGPDGNLDEWGLKAAKNFWDIYAQLEKHALGGNHDRDTGEETSGLSANTQQV